MKKAPLLPLILSVLALPGCTTFGCKGFPSVPICKSAVDAYHATDEKAAAIEEAALEGRPFLLGQADALAGIRSDPRVMRIWIAPYEDREGDLQTASYMLTEPQRIGWQSEDGHLDRRVLHPLQVSER